MSKPKVQMNVKVQNLRLLKFGLWIWFGIDSPLVHQFVRALTFDIASQEEIYGIRIQIS
jgi:hypothetical protein